MLLPIARDTLAVKHSCGIHYTLESFADHRNLLGPYAPNCVDRTPWPVCIAGLRFSLNRAVQQVISRTVFRYDDFGRLELVIAYVFGAHKCRKYACEGLRFAYADFLGSIWTRRVRREGTPIFIICFITG
jgi:hypothetical protein